MSSGDMNGWAKSSRRTDTKPTKVDKDDIPKMKMKDDLRALEKIIAEAQREAAKIRQRLDDVEESGNAPVNKLPAAKPDPELARIFAKNIIRADRYYISQAFHYLDGVLCARYTDALLDQFRDVVGRYCGETPDGQRPEDKEPENKEPEGKEPKTKTSWWCSPFIRPKPAPMAR
uniref:WGS project CBMI000000000 data, contig CS3069_c000978 n=1 Tax=Fusarium clavum TaxID=2594811 RepID=A0A090MHD2_9HYPO|nr:unnamed protein product [Fusarium clavum]